MDITSPPIRARLAGLPPLGLLRRLIVIWIAFWTLMLVAGVQEHLRLGGQHIWQPIVDNLTAAVVATGLAIVQMRRAQKLDALLDQPLRWFSRLWAWLPLQAVGYVALMYSLRFVLYAMAGERLRHGPWLDVFAYESTRFVLFYGLLGGVHFGIRSYEAWTVERLRVEQQTSLTRAAQLAQLTQQLQPHFLFNALNTISSLIHTDPDMADHLLTRLAGLLRAATDASSHPEQPLDDELRLLASYADIMTSRFGDRVSIAWQIAPDARGCNVPTLGLQPLLENCFRHGVERRRAPTHIVIRAGRDAARVWIEIGNDGDLVALPVHRGVGLGNLEQRLASLYGDRARLTLNAPPAGGLVARLEVPCAP